jgi:hypothetical protein
MRFHYRHHLHKAIQHITLNTVIPVTLGHLKLAHKGLIPAQPNNIPLSEVHFRIDLPNTFFKLRQKLHISDILGIKCNYLLNAAHIKISVNLNRSHSLLLDQFPQHLVTQKYLP